MSQDRERDGGLVGDDEEQKGRKPGQPGGPDVETQDEPVTPPPPPPGPGVGGGGGK